MKISPHGPSGRPIETYNRNSTAVNLVRRLSREAPGLFHFPEPSRSGRISARVKRELKGSLALANGCQFESRLLLDKILQIAEDERKTADQQSRSVLDALISESTCMR